MQENHEPPAPVASPAPEPAAAAPLAAGEPPAPEAAASADPVPPAAPAELPAVATPAAEPTLAQTQAALAERFPALFTPNAPRPIKLRVQADIQQRAPGVFTKKQLSIFLHRHTTSTAYIRALVASTQRFDLDGAPAGEIAAEHLEAAKAELERRRQIVMQRRAGTRGAGARPGPATSQAAATPDGVAAPAGAAPGPRSGRPPRAGRRPEGEARGGHPVPGHERHAERGSPRRATGTGAAPGRPDGAAPAGRAEHPRGGQGPRGQRETREIREPRGPRGAQGPQGVPGPRGQSESAGIQTRPHAPDDAAPPAAALEPLPDDPARRERALLLRAWESSPLTLPNFCALKGLKPADAEQQLDLARRERAERSAGAAATPRRT